MDETTSRICPWCSAEIPATSPACPKCGALVEGAKAIDLPEVTLLDPEAARPDEGAFAADRNPVSWLDAGTEPAPAEPIEPQAIEAPSPEPIEPEPIAPEPMAPVPIAPEPVAPEPITPVPMAPEPVAPEPITPMAPEPMAPVPIAPEPVAPEPITPMAPEPVAPEAIEPIAPEPIEPTPVAPEAIEPPADSVRLEMRKIELESEIENAGRTVMSPEGDESILVAAPSIEAIEAYEAGLLDVEGPAGETDLAENAQPWEDPELEQRLALWRQQNPDKA